MEHTTSMALLLRFISIVSVLDVTISSMPVQIISRIIAVSADSMLIVQMLIGKMRFTLDMSERRNAVNKSKIEWCDHTWNPITGCRHNCSYCYARRMTARFAGDVRLNLMAKKDYSIEPAADNSDNVFVLEEPMLNETGNTLVYPFGFEPTYHKYRMDYPEKLKMGNNIFVGAMADIFGKWVPDEWIRDVMETCLDNPIHNYLFLTKNPERYTEVGAPAGLENMWYGTTITCDADADRFNYLPAGCNTFVSIEPLMGDIVSKHNVMFRQDRKSVV